MKKIIACISISVLFCAISTAGYRDHRGHNTDSLHRVVASGIRDSSYFSALNGLSLAYRNSDPHYAVILSRQLFEECPGLGMYHHAAQGAHNIAAYYRAGGQQDSALVWALREFDMAEKMRDSGSYSEFSIDDTYSRACGNTGNIYCERMEYEKSIEYFQKALTVFEKNGWKQSSSTLYHNLGILYDEIGERRQAERYMTRSMELGEECGDSLAVAGAHLILGQHFVEEHKFRKAMDHLIEADKYYSAHEDQEFMGRIDLLDTLTAVRDNQIRAYRLASIGALLFLVLTSVILALIFKVKRREKALQDTADVLEETISELPKAGAGTRINLNDRELAILRMASEGKDSKHMAEELSLSLDTVYWYRKRLLAKFDARTLAEALSTAIKEGTITIK